MRYKMLKSAEEKNIIREHNVNAKIILDARQAMVFCTIKSLPQDQSDRIQSLTSLKDILYQQYGGKIFVELPDIQYYADALVAGFPAKSPDSSMPNQSKVFMVTLDNLKESLIKLNKVSDYTLEPFQESGISAEQLYDFKKQNAPSAVTLEKIKEGRFSAHAEQIRMKNTSLTQYILKSCATSEIVGCLTLVKHGKWLYLSDFITKEENWFSRVQSKCCCCFFGEMNGAKGQKKIDLKRLMISMLFNQISNNNAMHRIRGIWFIAPKWLTWVPKFIQEVPFPIELINQESHGVFIAFLPPRSKLLEAANRSLDPPHHSLDNDVVASQVSNHSVMKNN